MLPPLSPLVVNIHLQPATFLGSGIIKHVELTTGLKTLVIYASVSGVLIDSLHPYATYATFLRLAADDFQKELWHKVKLLGTCNLSFCHNAFSIYSHITTETERFFTCLQRCF